MSGFNKVILMGNLTRTPELRYTQGGTAICKFGMAMNRRFKDQSGEWKDEPTFVDITMFGKRGEAFSKYHDKGKPAFIEGSLRFDTWDDQQTGQKRSKLYVVADSWEFVGGGGSRDGGGAPRQFEDAPPAMSDGGGGGQAGGGMPGGYADSPAPADFNAEDAPF